MTLTRRTPGIKKRHSDDPKKFASPEGMWLRCPSCQAILQQKVVQNNLNLCTECLHHFRIGAIERIEQICDLGSFRELDANMQTHDVINFYDTKPYTERLESAKKKSGSNEAFISGSAKLSGRKICIGAFEFAFMGGSMGMVVGEKVARLFDAAVEQQCPAVIFHASGGARMQEGLLSLMQMGKGIAALSRLKERGLPYISVLTNPTTGGVAASFAMLGDINLAEPEALIGFAGPRVIEQTIKSKLPKGFQRSEYLLEHGMIDQIVDRAHMKITLERYLRYLS